MGQVDTNLREQAILNRVYEDTGKTLKISAPVAIPVSGSFTATTTEAFYAMKITVVGSITYVAKAPAGTAQSAAAWQAQKIDETTGTVITWAGGVDSFTNVATDLTALIYS